MDVTVSWVILVMAIRVILEPISFLWKWTRFKDYWGWNIVDYGYSVMFIVVYWKWIFHFQWILWRIMVEISENCHESCINLKTCDQLKMVLNRLATSMKCTFVMLVYWVRFSCYLQLSEESNEKIFFLWLNMLTTASNVVWPFNLK